jgi:uncharacterized protein YggE
MPSHKVPRKIQLSLDIKQLVILLLLVVIAVMLAIWKPWDNSGVSDRTVKVTGQATVKAEPDEFMFYPSYQFKNASKDVALADLSKKSDEITAKLKDLGVAPSKIRNNSSGNNYNYFKNPDNTTTYTLSLTVVATNKDQAQKVQDYLVTTTPLGNVSPQATFSDSLRMQLESQARDQATQDARAKADQSAHNLGFTVAKVKSVEDGAGFSNFFSHMAMIIPLMVLPGKL